MSYDSDKNQEKIISRLKELYTKHRELDNKIFKMYSNRMPDFELNRLKTKKLWYKDEIHRLESQLKAML